MTADGLSSLEILGGARIGMTRHLQMTVGSGAGLTRGIGTPAYRVFVGIAWVPGAADADGDGIADQEDACPLLPENINGIEDADGCPEDIEDRDLDGTPDDLDRCPDIPEDKDGDQDDDGCPEDDALDQDGDGIPDDEDSCPTQPEDLDGVRDHDGCPDIDNDFDGIPDDVDQCPLERETINGVEDDDGCPDEGEGLTEVAKDRIELKQTILFESGKAVLKPQSIELLKQVALQILAHPSVKKVRIEGHTDNRGDAEDNLYLSQDRADTVRRFLIERGVPQAMLEAAGFGEERPIETNNTAVGRARNRRVDFVLTQSTP
ncbi:MAG: OmpA family protein [Myxococcota bacterium]